MQKQEYTLQDYTIEELEKFAEEKSNFYLEAGGCITFNCLTGGSGIALIVILALVAAGFIYAKFFYVKGTFSKLTAKFSRK